MAWCLVRFGSNTAATGDYLLAFLQSLLSVASYRRAGAHRLNIPRVAETPLALLLYSHHTQRLALRTLHEMAGYDFGFLMWNFLLCRANLAIDSLQLSKRVIWTDSVRILRCQKRVRVTLQYDYICIFCAERTKDWP